MIDPTYIVDMPPSERPSLVDSISLTLRSYEMGLVHLEPWQARDMQSLWANFAGQIAVTAAALPELGIDRLLIQPGQPMIDCKPGKNRYAIYDEFKSPAYMNGILKDFAPHIHIPRQADIFSFIKGKDGLDTPYVFKDVSANRGTNKFLIETPKQQDTLLRFLRQKKKDDIKNTVVEEFIETPGEKSSSYRYTMTPTGTIIAVALLNAGATNEVMLVKEKDTTRHFVPLADPKSVYFLGSRSITSNTNEGRTDIGLHFEGRDFELADVTEEQEALLELHGISVESRKPSKLVEEAALQIARTLGPSIGLCIGVDIIQQAHTGTPFFLEANSLPMERSINSTIHPNEPKITRDELYTMAFLSTLFDLATPK